MSGLGQSAPPTDAPVVDTAEQVLLCLFPGGWKPFTNQVFHLIGVHFFLGIVENVKAWQSWSSYGSDGSHAW